MPLYRVDWLGENATILSSSIIDRADIETAGKVTSRKWMQSFHLIPEGCRGFYITPYVLEKQSFLEIYSPKSFSLTPEEETAYEQAKAEGFGSIDDDEE